MLLRQQGVHSFLTTRKDLAMYTYIPSGAVWRLHVVAQDFTWKGWFFDCRLTIHTHTSSVLSCHLYPVGSGHVQSWDCSFSGISSENGHFSISAVPIFHWVACYNSILVNTRYSSPLDRKGGWSHTSYSHKRWASRWSWVEERWDKSMQGEWMITSYSPEVPVVAVSEFISVSPLIRLAVSVIAYSVPSSRPSNM